MSIQIAEGEAWKTMGLQAFPEKGEHVHKQAIPAEGILSLHMSHYAFVEFNYLPGHHKGIYIYRFVGPIPAPPSLFGFLGEIDL